MGRNVRSTRGDRYAEKIRRKALRRGLLVDVSREAVQAGLAVPLAISRRLWTSLVQPFPSARPCDCLPLLDLIHWIADEVLQQTPRGGRVLFATPSVKTYWMRELFCVRIQRICRGDKVASVVLLAYDEPYIRLLQGSSPSLPATLLVRLALSVRNLGPVSRACDAASLDIMLATVNRLLGQSPVQSEVKHYVERWAAGVPSSFTPEEYRSVLLRTLAELVSLAAVSTADPPTALLVESLQRRQQTLASRLSDLSVLVESLLRLAATLRSPPGPVPPNPFRPLLSAYVAMHRQLEGGWTLIASEVLASVKLQMSLMESLASDREAETLAVLKAEFQRLEGKPRAEPMVNLARSTGKVLWQ